MPKFVIISGTLVVKAPDDSGKKQLTVGFGAEVEMSKEDHRAVDPKGERLVSPESFAELKKAADAHRAFLAKQKELGAGLVELSPKLLTAFDKLALETKKPEPKAEPKKEGGK